MSEENYRKYLDPETLARLEGLQLRARLIVEGYVSGLHRSPYHGFSIEFAEHREYAPGDDLRYLDWKVFGRTDKLYLKQYEDETNFVVYLILDVSRSMEYQSDDAPMSKIEYARCLAGALSHLVLRQQDSVGLVTFDEEIRALVRPRGNRTHLEQIFHVMEESSPKNKTSAGRIFHRLAEQFTKRGLVIVLSDLFDDVKPMLAGLKHFRHRRHEVVLWHVLDPAEVEFPFRDPTLFKGLEGQGDVTVDARALRKAYKKEFGQFVHEVKQGCRMHGIDYVPMQTDTPFDVALSSYLAARMTRGTS